MTELILSREGERTVFCLFSSRCIRGRAERHDLFCWTSGRGAVAAIPDMGGTFREDHGFFLAFSASSPDPSFLLECFEDR